MKATTYSPTDGQPAENMPPIRVGIFRQGELLHTTQLPHPAVAYSRAWLEMDPADELRVLPDEPRD